MRVAIAGAGNVGQSIARALLATGHTVLIIERSWPQYRPQLVPDADWMYADACEYATLQTAGIDTTHVVIAATGDDKVNLVFAMLAKTQFAVARVVARVNEPANQWLFSAQWGVDVAVSTPRRLAAAVEEVVTVGDVVQLMTLQQGAGSIFEFTLPPGSPLVDRTPDGLPLPADAALLAVLRGNVVHAPSAELELAAADELVLLVSPDAEARLRDRLLRG